MSAGLVRSGRRGLVVVLGAVLAAAPTAYPAAGMRASEPPPEGGVVSTLTTHEDGYPGTTSVVDLYGNTTVVWSQHWWRGPIRAVRRPAGGEWGSPVTIAQGGTSPIAAADAQGNVTVVFQTNRHDRTTGVSAVRRLVNGGWQHPVPLSKDVNAPGYGPPNSEGTFGAHRLDLAVNPHGDTVVVWQWGSFDRDRPFRIESIYRPRGGTWGPLTRLTKPNWSQNPHVAIGPGGNATAVYGRFSRRRVVGQGWRGPVPTPGTSSGADLVIDRWGTATFTFPDYRHGTTRIMASRRPADTAAWPKPQRISPKGIDIFGSFSQVQHPSGGISVAMQRQSGRIDVVRRPPGGPWRAPVQVSSPSPSAYSPPVVATNATEVLFVLWKDQNLGLQGRIRYPAGGWTPTFQVSPDSVTDYEAGAYPNGDTLAVWEVDNSVKARQMLK